MGVHLFGIRHHGPGSANSLIRALEATQPDCMLIEGPADAEAALQYCLHPGLELPAALLLYDAKDLSKAAYLPFADFSPEWQAMQFALAQGIELRLMDLPMHYQFNLGTSPSRPPALRDPLGYIAELAGYSDSERWWEATFEQTDNDQAVFEVVADLMTALREEIGQEEDQRTQQREAYMRRSLRKAIKDGFEDIAVVCGAWHVPALSNLKKHPIKTDNALLKGLKKSKTVATWIPWSYPQLAFQSGYGAGVVSPAWYELLFSGREAATVRWMAKVAGRLREEGIDASSAHAVEAVRLAETLAALRGQPIPGLPELREAAISVFGGGKEGQWQLIEQGLVIGERAGKVPGSIPQPPLQRDMEARIRSARLTKLYQSPLAQQKELDLRKPSHLDASQLLHQLRILDIEWGTPQEGTGRELGSFQEYWRLHWQAGYYLKLVAAGMYGNTVQVAAAACLLHKAKEQTELDQLVQLANQALVGGLSQVFAELAERMQAAAALSQDVGQLMEALPLLTSISRYGDTRQTDVESVDTLIHQLIPRITVGLPTAVMNIDNEAATDWRGLLTRNNHAIGLLDESEYQHAWEEALLRLMHNQAAHALLRGMCCRLSLDKNRMTEAGAATQMHYVLSDASGPMEGAAWLEGFLHGSALLLLYSPALWGLLDSWVVNLPEERFTDILPVLRRAFANFPGPERARLLALTHDAQVDVGSATDAPLPFDQSRAKVVLPTLRALLGLE